MARNVTDAALALDAMTGRDGTVPFATAESGGAFLSAARNPRRPGRIAFSLDLGITVVDRQVETVVRQAIGRLAGEGFEIVEACPDLSGVVETFQVLRAVSYAVSNAPLLHKHRDRLKPEVVWNIETGLALDGAAVVKAQREQVRLFHATRTFMDSHDLLVCPATIVPPFPAGERYVTECNGVTFETYIDWMAITWGLTVVSLPVLAIPCGVTAAGLPVGLQIAGRPGGEAELIAMARTIEDAIGDWRPKLVPEFVVH